MLGNVPGSIRVARIFGIDINVHFSWIVIFFVVVTNLSESIYPDQFPKWSREKTFVVSAVSATLFFVSVVAHELAHSLVARRFQMTVSSITLFMLGGVASLTREPPSAKAELFMAAAGPLTSIVIGVGGAKVGPLMTADFRSTPPGVMVGQIIRDFVLPMNLRAIPVVSGERLVGLITIADLRKVEQDRWATTPVEQVMTPASELATVSPDDPLGTALERFGGAEVPLLPVVKDGRLIGVLYREAVIGYVRMQEMLAPQGR